MAIDWEDILGAEGAELSDAWEDAVWEGQKLADRYFDEYLNQKEDIESRYHESLPEEEDPHGWEDFSDHIARLPEKSISDTPLNDEGKFVQFSESTYEGQGIINPFNNPTHGNQPQKTSSQHPPPSQIAPKVLLLTY